MKPKAYVLGLYGANALGVVRSLGSQKIPTVGLHSGERIPYAKHSRFLSDRYYATSGDELVERLLQLGTEQDEKGVLFCTGDEYVLLCDSYKNELQHFYHFPRFSQTSIIPFLDKERNVLLGKLGEFKIPRSTYLNESTDSLQFPVIAKPLLSIGASKKDMFVFDSAQDLRVNRKSLLRKYGNMSVQEFIPGDSSNIFEVHMYCSESTSFFIGMQQNKVGISLNPSVYVGTVFESIWVDELIYPSFKLATNLQYRGPLDINLKRSADSNEFYFLEVNFRTSANVALDTASGRNLPAIMYADFTGQDFSYLLDTYKVGKRWIHEKRVVNSILNGDLFKIVTSLSNVRSSVFWNKSDVKPFFMQLPEILKS